MAISGLDFGDRDSGPIQNMALFEPALIDPNKRAATLLDEDLSIQREAYIVQSSTPKTTKVVRGKLKKRARETKSAKLNDVDVNPKPSNKVTITGWVHDERGAGVAGQTIQLRSPTHKNKLAQAKSDTQGVFTFESVQTADDYRVAVKISGPYELKVKRQAILNVYNGMPDLDISMLNTGAGTVGLTIHTTSGYPIKEQQFQLISLNRVIDQQGSNASGYVEFTNVPATGGRPNLKIRSTGTPIYIFSNLSLTRGQINTALRTQVHHGEHNLLVTVKNEGGLTLTDINAKLTWTKSINGILSETIRVTDNSLNGRNETSRAQQQASNPERTIIRFTGLGSGKHRLDLLGPQTEASYGEPISINQYNQQVEITMQSFMSLGESLH